MKLDKYWEYQKRMQCPSCKKIGLWYNSHEDADATHYCKKCEEGFVIIGSSKLRNKEVK